MSRISKNNLALVLNVEALASNPVCAEDGLMEMWDAHPATRQAIANANHVEGEDVLFLCMLRFAGIETF